MAAIPQGAVCLITGGFGGIGQAIARELASPLRVRARWLTVMPPVTEPRPADRPAVIRQYHALPVQAATISAAITHQCLNFLDMVFRVVI